MNSGNHPEEANAALRREAIGWLVRLTSGTATAADAVQFMRWRAERRERRRAFAEASLLWETLGEAAETCAARPLPRAEPPHRGSVRLGRRAFVGGAVAASAAAVGHWVARPPWGLWPSFAELAADYRTGIGERRQVSLGNGLSVEMNTQTSIAVRSADAGAGRIELIAGEAMVAVGPASPSLMVVAEEGAMIARQARFSIRRDVASVRVACLEGGVRVIHREQALDLGPLHQIAYGANGLGRATAVDPSVVTAWQHGMLVFRFEPLTHVIDEINRYRPGRIILLNEALGRQPVVASIRLDRMDEVVTTIWQTFGARVTELPGGLVLLS
jgi:transmembrane sensor